MHRIRDVLREISPVVGVTARFPAGELFERAAHCMWLLDYPSDFGPQGADFTSSAFIELVNAKLAELGAPPIAEQGKSFGMDEKRRRKIEAGLSRDLAAVLRTDAPELDLDKMLARFNQLWRDVLLS